MPTRQRTFSMITDDGINVIIQADNEEEALQASKPILEKFEVDEAEFFEDDTTVAVYLESKGIEFNGNQAIVMIWDEVLGTSVEVVNL
jgi:hypothetical protein